jgi:biotin carboxylase
MTSEAGGSSPEIRRVLIVSHTTGYQLRAFNDAADALGVRLAFATDRCHLLDDPWQDHAIPVRFHDLDGSIDAIRARAGDLPIHGIVAVGDRPVVLAARAAEALGIRWHPVAGAQASTDKRRARAAIAAAGLPSPAFEVRPASDVEPGTPNREPRTADVGPRTSDVGFPCVLKPVGLSGSRGVIRANGPREFADAFARIRALLARPQVRAARSGLEDELLVEAYIDGREFALEGVLTGGALQVFAIFDKPDPLVGPFFEETIYVTPSTLDAREQARVADHVERAAIALGLHHGPVHAECRVTPDGTIYVLEVAARPIGGLCSRVLTFVRAGGWGLGNAAGAGRSLEDVLLHHALGEDISAVRREEGGAAVMMIPIPRRGILKGVTGEEAARACAGVTDIRITAKIGQLLEPLPEAGSYLGFIFARGATAAEAESAVRAAHARLTFDVAREIPVG